LRRRRAAIANRLLDHAEVPDPHQATQLLGWRDLDPGEDATCVSVEQFERLLDTVVGRREVGLIFEAARTDLGIGPPRGG
jgi:hypothetical protein